MAIKDLDTEALVCLANAYMIAARNTGRYDCKTHILVTLELNRRGHYDW